MFRPDGLPGLIFFVQMVSIDAHECSCASQWDGLIVSIIAWDLSALLVARRD